MADRVAAAAQPVAEAVLVPVLNEEGAIGAFLAELAAHVRGRRVYVLDSHSRDGTVAEARSAAARWGVDLVVLESPRGLATAIAHGIDQTTEPRLAVIDGDGQHAPAGLDPLFAALAAGNDLAVASRAAAGATVAADWPRHRRLATKVVLMVLRAVGRCHGVSDPMAGCFALRRAAWRREAARFDTGGFKFLLDFLTVARRPRVAEVGVAFRARAAGRSKLAFSVYWELLVSLAWNVLRGVVPRRFIGFAAVGTVGTGVDAAVTGLLHAVLGLPFWVARPGGMFVAATNNYLLNNRLTFVGCRRSGAESLARGWLLYAGTQIIGSLTNYAVSVTLEWAGLWWLVALLVGALAGLALNFFFASRLVWGGRGLRRGD